MIKHSWYWTLVIHIATILLHQSSGTLISKEIRLLHNTRMFSAMEIANTQEKHYITRSIQKAIFLGFSIIYQDIHNIARVLVAQRILIHGPATINQITIIKCTELSH